MRSKTPISLGKSKGTINAGASNESSNTLQDISTAVNKSFKSGMTGTSGPSSLTGTKIKANLYTLKPIATSVNRKLGTPNSKSKNEIKNLLLFQPHNNYTKNFMKKKSIDGVTNQHKDSKSTSKERHSVSTNVNRMIPFNLDNSHNLNTDSNIGVSSNNKVNHNNSNMNINVGNVNINLNNKTSNLTTINSYAGKRFDDRKLSILDIGGDGPLIDIESLIIAGQENMKKSDYRKLIIFIF